MLFLDDKARERADARISQNALDLVERLVPLSDRGEVRSSVPCTGSVMPGELVLERRERSLEYVKPPNSSEKYWDHRNDPITPWTRFLLIFECHEIGRGNNRTCETQFIPIILRVFAANPAGSQARVAIEFISDDAARGTPNLKKANVIVLGFC